MRPRLIWWRFLDPKQSRIDIAQATDERCEGHKDSAPRLWAMSWCRYLPLTSHRRVWIRQSSLKHLTKSRTSSMPYKSTMRT